jgi:hypothetical protein
MSTNPDPPLLREVPACSRKEDGCATSWTGDQSGARLIMRILADWRFWLVLSPVVIIAFAVFYLFKTCYPSAVFLWGDMEEWYGKLLRRRSIIWQVIVISMSVGILSNLFVFGLAGYFKK